MTFRQCFLIFFDTSEVPKNFYQNFYKISRRRQIVPVGPRNWTKKVFRVTYNTGRGQRVPPFFFFGIVRLVHKQISGAVEESTLTLWHSLFAIFWRLWYGADLGRSRLVLLICRRFMMWNAATLASLFFNPRELTKRVLRSFTKL